MRLAPLPHPLDIFRSTEVIFVLRLARPAPLAGRLRRLAAFRPPAVVLTPAIAGITNVLFPAMQALEGRFCSHRLARNEPPNLRVRTHLNQENPRPPHPPNKTKNKTKEEEFCGKLLKKTQVPIYPAFKPDRSSGFQTAALTSLQNKRRDAAFTVPNRP